MSINGVLLQPVVEECPYLEQMISITETLLIKQLDEKDLEKLLSIGFRHFGEIFFKPLCRHCRKCISLRIPVRQFKPSRSVRRLFNRNKHFQISFEKPKPSLESFSLYNKHKKRFKRRMYESFELYVKSFFHPFPFNKVLSIKDGNHLVALSHLDVTKNTMSAVYCYFDEKYKKFSPGKFSVYKEIELAREMGIKWLYLGYHVPGNRHTQYKINFKPSQFLTEWGKWVNYIDRSGKVLNPFPFSETKPSTILSKKKKE